MNFSEIAVYTTSEMAEVVAYFLQEVCMDGVSIYDKKDLYDNPSWDYKEEGIELQYASEVVVKGYWGENIGATRKYYTISEKGRELYAVKKREWENAKMLIDILIK